MLFLHLGHLTGFFRIRRHGVLHRGLDVTVAEDVGQGADIPRVLFQPAMGERMPKRVRVHWLQAGPSGIPGK